ncbi:hypothetical protein ACROYT_G033572 [Oculina patagonica]
MKNNKAPGYDDIPAELLKADIETATEVLFVLFGHIWQEEQLPGDWRKGLIVKIPKKGDTTECTNWRGITLLSVVSKVFTRIILTRIQNAVDNQLRKEQAGFRKGRSCTEQIFTLRNIIEQCMEWQASLHLNFIDFEKAFDSVHRITLWKLLRLYGVPHKIIRMIQALYKDFTCSVLHEGNLTPWFAVKTGVKQGCMLSFLLFLITLDWVMKETTSHQRTGIRWKLTTVLEDLDYAYDLCLLSTHGTHLGEKTARLQNNARRVGLKINTKKTKWMSTGCKRNCQIKIDGHEIEKIEQFSYLGSVIDVQGGADADVKTRIGKARQAFIALKPVWRSKRISLKTKLRLFNSNVKTVLLYGSESWKTTQDVVKKLRVFIHKCLRIILGIRWPQKISNLEVRNIRKQEDIMVSLTRRKWSWIGHVLRKDSGDVAKEGLFWTPEGKRARGRPRTTWRRRLGTNNITYLDAYVFSTLYSLEFLLLSSNNIEILPVGLFANTPKLYLLELSYNKIKYLQKDVFLGIDGIAAIYLHNNQIRSFSNQAFAKTSNAENIFLGANLLENIPRRAFSYLRHTEEIQCNNCDLTM